MGSLVWALAGQLLPIPVGPWKWLLHEAHPASGLRGRQRGAREWPSMVYRTATPPAMDESSGLGSSLSCNSAALTSDAQAPPPTPQCNRPGVTGI